MELRPHQLEAIQSLRESVRAHKRVLLVAPCSFGKTVVATEIIKSFRAKSKGLVLFLVHRRELVNQTVNHLHESGVKCGVIRANDRRANWKLPVQVATIQTLHRRLEQLPAADLIFVDETHYAMADSWQSVLDRYPTAIIIGLTATPWRMDGRGLGDLYSKSIVIRTPNELIREGYIVDYDAYRYSSPDTSNINITCGEFNQKELAEITDKDELIGDICSEYIQHAAGRRAIVFPINCIHSKHIVDRFNARGFPAIHLDWATSEKERDRMFEDFRIGRVLILSSVGVLTTGFDCPPAEVCILARATKSLSLYLQMLGRVLRLSPETGKTRALIHDHGGNLQRFGLPDQERNYDLTTTSQKVLDIHTCTNCRAVVNRWASDGTCPKCGDLQKLKEEKIKGEESRAKKLEVIEKEGVRIAMVREQFAEKKIKRQLNDEEALLVSLATKEQKMAEYKRLETIRVAKNLKPGFVGHEFRKQFGHWPRYKGIDLINIQPASKSYLPYRKKIE
jgi:DNA repair protein RadD